MNFLSGQKTYLTAGSGAFVTLAYGLGYIDGETATTLLSLLGFGGLAAMRAGAKKAEVEAQSARLHAARAVQKSEDSLAHIVAQEASKKARKK